MFCACTYICVSSSHQSSSQVIDHYNMQAVNSSNFTGYREVYIRYAYDAVWVMALALQKSLPLLKEKGLSLEDFHLFTEKGKNISEIVRNVVQDIKFTGVSVSLNCCVLCLSIHTIERKFRLVTNY